MGFEVDIAGVPAVVGGSVRDGDEGNDAVGVAEGVFVGDKDEGDDVLGIAKGVFVRVEVDIDVGFVVVGILVRVGEEGDVGIAEGVVVRVEVGIPVGLAVVGGSVRIGDDGNDVVCIEKGLLVGVELDMDIAVGLVMV